MNIQPSDAFQQAVTSTQGWATFLCTKLNLKNAAKFLSLQQDKY